MRGSLLFPLGLTLSLCVLVLPGCETGSGSTDGAAGPEASTPDSSADHRIPPDLLAPDLCEPYCHWDCFSGGGYICSKGQVWMQVGGARECCRRSDPWPGGGPPCTADTPVMSCSSGSCATATVVDKRYGHCVQPKTETGYTSHLTHLLELYCTKDFYRKAGAICSGDPDCRPSEQDHDHTLKCVKGTCQKVAKAAPPTNYRQSCGLTKADVNEYQPDGVYSGKTCLVCHAGYDTAKKCLRQGCTMTCKYDDDCPKGSVCVCAPRASSQIVQVCAPATAREKPEDRLADLKCE